MFWSVSDSCERTFWLLLNFYPSGKYGTPRAVTYVLDGFEVEMGRDCDVLDCSVYFAAV